MIKTADWIIDLGPEAWPGLDPGAATAAASKPARWLDPRVAAGTPEEIVKTAASSRRSVRRSSESEDGSPKGEG